MTRFSAIDGLLQSLGDQDFSIHGSAAKALGHIGSIEVIPRLLKALKDQSFFVHWSAVDALEKIGNSKP